MKIKNISLALLFVGGLFATYKVLADETVPEKIQSGADEANTNVKKGARKVKRNLRDATGNHSTKEDMKDAAKDVKDDVKTKAKKIKRKVD